MIWSLCFTILFAGNYVIASVDQDDQVRRDEMHVYRVLAALWDSVCLIEFNFRFVTVRLRDGVQYGTR